MFFHPCETNFDDQELAQLTEFLRAWQIDDDAVEYGIQLLFDAGRYELAQRTREKLMKVLSRAGMSVSGQLQ